MTTAVSTPAKPAQRPNYIFPVGLLILVLLPLLLMPLAAVFIFAFQGGLTAFVQALGDPDAQFALRFSLLIARNSKTRDALVFLAQRIQGRLQRGDLIAGGLGLAFLQREQAGQF